MKNKIVSIVLCIPLAFGISACSGAQESPSNETAETSIDTPTPTATEKPTETPALTPTDTPIPTKEPENLASFMYYDLYMPLENSTIYKGLSADGDGYNVYYVFEFSLSEFDAAGTALLQKDFDAIRNSEYFNFEVSIATPSIDNDVLTTPLCGYIHDDKAYVICVWLDSIYNITGQITFNINAKFPTDNTYAYSIPYQGSIWTVSEMNQELATQINDGLTKYGSSEQVITAEVTATPEPTPTMPLEYSNALGAAHDYLNVMAFSYNGLIDQLEYEGYSAEACTYAADNCGADWNQQALEKAQSYLDFSAFSYSGLIDQLEYEGFTIEQSTYAVDSCGADWNEQAAKKAQDYLDFTSFSRQGLIDQLIYEGFTTEQAEYGVSAVGY